MPSSIKRLRAQDPSLADDLCPSLAKLATLNLSSGPSGCLQTFTTWLKKVRSVVA